VSIESAQQQVQSIVALCTGGSSLDGVFRVATSVQRIMTELNGAVSEEEKSVHN
jgi:hypothetical protein